MMSQTILIFRPDHLGDVLLTTPVLRHMRNVRPDVRIVMAVGRWSRPIVAHQFCVDEIVELDLPWLDRSRSSGWFAMLRQIWRLRRRRFDHVFNFRVAAKSALVARLIGGTRRWGFDEKKCTWAHHETVSLDTDKSVVENYCRLIQSWTEKEEPPGLLEFPLVDAGREQVAAALEEHHISEPYLVCAPGAGYPMKLWHAGHWASLISIARESYRLSVIVTGSEGERDMVDGICATVRGPVTNLCGKLSLDGLAALLKGARALVAVDSFTMHLGASQETPMVALFGPTNHRHWGPWPPNERNRIVTRNQKAVFHKQDCAEARTLMTQIPVHDVVETLDALMLEIRREQNAS
jgi:lipopolysaccharide heptosyltransferase II